MTYLFWLKTSIFFSLLDHLMGVRVLLASKPTGLWHPSYVSADNLGFLYAICSWSYTKLHLISSSRQAYVRSPSKSAKVSKARDHQGWPVEAGPATQIDGTWQCVSEAARRTTSLQSHTLTFLIGHGVQGKSQMTGKGQTLHPTTKSAKQKKTKQIWESTYESASRESLEELWNRSS